MSSFRTKICQGVKTLLASLKSASGDASLDSLSFAARTDSEPALPFAHIECVSATERIEGARLFDCELVVTLESSIDEGDDGAAHDSRLAWLECELDRGKALLADWPVADVTPVSLRVTDYAETPPDKEGRRVDSITLVMPAHPWRRA